MRFGSNGAGERPEGTMSQGRIQFYEGDFFSVVPPTLRCDLIVSNPPYIPSARI